MLAHTWLDFFLSTAPSALLLLLLWASSICHTLTVLGLSCHSWLDSLLSPPASTASQGIPHLHSNLGLFQQCYPPCLPFLCSVFLRGFAEALCPWYFQFLQSRYCALVREAWDINNVFCLRYGMRNQENWLLSCFCHRPDRKLRENLAKNLLFCVTLVRSTNTLRRTGQHLQPQVQMLHLTGQL